MNKYKTLGFKEYEEMLKEIGTSKDIDLTNYNLMVFGSGGQSKKLYSELKVNPDYEVLWTGWSGPKWTKFLSFIPGQAGLIKIVKQKSFFELYLELSSYSVTDAIYIRKELTKKITETVRKKIWKTNFESFVQNEQNSFLLTSEADTAITENDKAKILYDYNFGSELNQSIKNILSRNEKTPHNNVYN